MADFTTKEKKTINDAWSALEYCADQDRSAASELADALKYETGSKTAGRPRIWAKALIIDAYVEGRYGNTTDRRVWLYNAIRLSRGVRFGYLLACSGTTWRNEVEESQGVNLTSKLAAAVEAYKACLQRRVTR